ncbi:unnamed protein product [Peronospora farinosa]|uniref:Glycosylphosphatidylinositol anchor biosynthesis protein 11 n=1 Tax=Peronospora farinosa TaxID=134698 RepID=A0AAV0TD42_9STRA|nr:unnamed protein product [Peronospora farinosa]CAI5719846.1 unnamed protein product [Peronospora farinosa]
MESLLQSLQLVVPGIVARYLPIFLFGHYLEDAVVAGLVPVVAAIVCFSFTLNLLILHSSNQSLIKHITSGIIGLMLGTAVFHVVVVLFGAPVVDLWMQTLLLAVLLSSCVTMPLALHLGCAPRKWLDLLLELSVTNTQEHYLVCSSIGSMVGAYVGALPIPLDWDRPWQQWPLTCVYGTLLGHATGVFISLVISATSMSFSKSAKKD